MIPVLLCWTHTGKCMPHHYTAWGTLVHTPRFKHNSRICPTPQNPTHVSSRTLLHSLLKWNAVLTSQAHLSRFWSLWKQNYTAYIFVGTFGFSSELSVTVYVWKIHLFGCVRQQLFHIKCCLMSYCLASAMSTVSEHLDCFQCWTAHKNAAVNKLGVCLDVQHELPCWLGMCLWMELLRHWVCTHPHSVNIVTFSKRLNQSTFSSSALSAFSHLGGCVVIFCCLNSHFPHF